MEFFMNPGIARITVIKVPVTKDLLYIRGNAIFFGVTNVTI